MYKEAYELLREILDDETLNEYIFNETGKHLAVIDAGAQITTPSAKITFSGGGISQSDNVMQFANYNVAFAFPFWDANALGKSHEFLDVAVKAFFEHEMRTNSIHINRVMRVSPSISEYDEESELWTVAFDVAVSIFID
ncbi:MAG: hypothetical protein IJQ08_03550 [Synergistaceae bacterium]|nr:hypothetical protein [Synergistaceae bacterium]